MIMIIIIIYSYKTNYNEQLYKPYNEKLYKDELINGKINIKKF